MICRLGFSSLCRNCLHIIQTGVARLAVTCCPYVTTCAATASSTAASRVMIIATARSAACFICVRTASQERFRPCIRAALASSMRRLVAFFSSLAAASRFTPRYAAARIRHGGCRPFWSGARRMSARYWPFPLLRQFQVGTSLVCGQVV